MTRLGVRGSAYDRGAAASQRGARVWRCPATSVGLALLAAALIPSGASAQPARAQGAEAGPDQTRADQTGADQTRADQTGADERAPDDPAGHAASAQLAPEETAQTSFARGERLFAAHDYAAALTAFRLAFRIAPHDAVRFNMAVCLERLARFSEALAEYTAAAASTMLDDETRTRARELGARVRPFLVRLAVSGNPIGAEVLVDGELRCTVPCEALIDPRPQTILVRDALLEETRHVDPSRGDVVTMDVHLAPRLSDLPLTSMGEPDSWPRWPTWFGLITGGVAGSISIVLGVRTGDIHAQYLGEPSLALREEGIGTMVAANVFLGLACVGALFVIGDVIAIAAE